MRLSIRTKLVLTFIGAMLMSIIVGSLLIGTLIWSTYTPGGVNPLIITSIVESGVAQVRSAVEAGVDNAALRSVAIPADLPVGVRVEVVTNDNRVLVDSEGAEGRQLSARELASWIKGWTNGGHALTQTVPQEVTVNEKPWGYYVVTYQPAFSLRFNWNGSAPIDRTARWVLIGTEVSTITLALLIFWLFGHHLVRPIRRLSGAMGRIAAGDLSSQVDLGNRGDELGQLARDLNAMTEALQSARDQAATAEQSRRYLVAAASHDLRSPLTALLGHAEALQAGISDDPEQSLTIIQEKGLQLKRLIDDLFELAALDATQERWQTVRVNVAELVRLSVVGLLPDLEGAEVEVDAEIPDEPMWANLAPGKLERVVDNLLTNALKYGVTGKWVGAKLVRSGRWLRVEIADRGPGVDERARERLFERFYRADNARTSPQGGSGLGLAIAREIIQRHGGRMGVENRAGGGATFWFEIPAVD